MEKNKKIKNYKYTFFIILIFVIFVTFPIKILLAYNNEKITERIVCNDTDVACLINDSLSLFKKNIPDFSNLDNQFEIKTTEFSVNKKTNLTATAIDISIPLSNKEYTNNTSLGSSLVSVAGDLAYGWNYFIKGLINNFVETRIALNQAVIGIDNKNTDTIISDNNTSKKTVPSIPSSNKENPKTTKNEIIPPAIQITKTDTKIIQGSQGLIGPVGPQGPKGENGNSIDVSNFVSEVFFSRQVSKIFDSISDSIKGLSNSLADEVETKSLIVSGDANINGDLTITGNLTGNVVGTINPAFTFGSIPFQGASGLTEDNTNLFWDSTNSRLGIGTSTPSEKISVDGNILATGNIIGSNLSGTNTGDETNSSIKTKLGVATNLVDGYLASTDWLTFNNKQPAGNYLTPSNLSGLIPYTGGNTNVDLGLHNLTVDTNTLFVDSVNHRVGMGTTSPTDALTVTGNIVPTVSSGGSLGIPSKYWTTSYIAGLNMGSGQISSIAGVIGSTDFFIKPYSSSYAVKFMVGSTEYMRMNGNGNIGIGTTNPTQKLEVEGNVLIGNDSTDSHQFLFSNSQGALFFDGSSRMILGSASGRTLAFRTGGFGSDSLTRMLIDNTGNVGIGTTAPTAGLHLTDKGIRIGATTIGNTPKLIFGYDGSGGGNYMELYSNTNTGDGYINNIGLYPLHFMIGGSDKVTILNNGNVGIGTTNPLEKLHISAGNLIIENGQSINFRRPSWGNIAGIYANYTTNLEGYLIFQTNNGSVNSEKMRIDKDGNVGIGTTTPNQQLEITKNFRLPTTTGSTPYGIIYKGSSPFISDFSYGLNSNSITPTGNNIFIGIGAGNLTTGSTATMASQSSLNTVIGSESFTSNTTGFNNTSLGYRTLTSNTTGNNNMAIGILALYSNTTGTNNTAIGRESLFANVTSSNNTANGAYALSSTTAGNNTASGYASMVSNTTGSLNTAYGYQSARYISDGITERTTGNNGLYLGGNSKASDNGTDNEIVIGYNAIGQGSNTVTLGNTNITKTLLNGNVGIGTTSPIAKLQIGPGGSDTTLSFNLGATNTYSSIQSYNSNLALNPSGNNVGIGTTSPTTLLNLGTGNFRIENGSIFLPNGNMTVSSGGIDITRNSTLTGLTVNQNGTGKIVEFLDGANSALSVIDGGNVGIGTNTPTGLLSILQSGDTANDGIRIERVGASRATIALSALTGNLEISRAATTIMSIGVSNIGIGTTTPTVPLQIGDSAFANNALVGLVSGANQDSGFVMAEGAGSLITGTSYGFKLFYNGASANTFNVQSMEGAGFVDRLTINRSTGNVGIGTTTPGANLEIYKAGENANLKLYAFSSSAYDSQVQFSANTNAAVEYSIGLDNSDNNFKIFSGENVRGTSEFVINPSGNVGIGTTAPGALLHVGSTNSTIRYTQINSNGQLLVNYNNNGDAIPITLRNMDQSSGISHSITQDAYFARTTSSAPISAGYLRFGKEQEWTTTNTTNDSFISFGSALDSVTSEKMRITSAGNVGIGITNPAAKLEVNSTFLTEFNTTTNGSYGVRTSGPIKGNEYYLSNLSGGFRTAGGNYMFYSDTAGRFATGSSTGLSGLYNVIQSTTGNGTVATTGTTTLTGTNTSFLSTFKVGDTVTVSGETARIISTIASDTVLTVSVAFSNTASGLSYTLIGGNRFAVMGNGNVGIGTTTPAYPLDVNGVVRATSASTQVAPFITSNTSAGSSGVFSWVYEGLTPNIVNNSGSLFLLGKAKSTNNSAHFDYVHVSDGSTSNRFSIGMYNNDNLLNVLASGNVGIGTTTPTLGKLEVKSVDLYNVTPFALAVHAPSESPYMAGFFNDTKSTTVPGLAYFGWNNGDVNIGTFNGKFFFGAGGTVSTGATTRMAIDNTNGNVGIGTTSPSELLDITGISTAGTSLRLYNNTTAYGDRGIIKFNGNTAGGGNTNTSMAQIVAGHTDIGTTNYLDFKVGSWNNNNTIGSTMMRINSSGNVGIGTTSPSSKLTVVGDIAFSGGGLTLNWSGNAAITNATYDLAFKNYDTGGATLRENMRITGSGNVGIGTTTPTGKLHVVGTSTVATDIIKLSAGSGTFFVNNVTSNSIGPIIDYDINASATITNFIRLGNGTMATGATNGITQNIITSTPTIATASNSTTFNVLNIAPTVNQTGTANGITRGIYVNPTLTSAPDFRAIETNVASGTGRYGYYGAGTAISYFGGNVGIGTATPAANLDVLGNIKSSSTIAFGGNGRLNHAGSGITSYVEILNQSIGGIRFKNSLIDLMSVDNLGNVGIGNTSPSYQLQVGNNTVSGIVVRFENSTGTCDINPTTASLACSSDINLKKNITTLENSEFILKENIDTSSKSLEKILALTPVMYNWNNENDNTNKHVGFIAQEVEQIFPDIVFTDPNTNLKSISYTNLIPYTVKAIQEMDLIVKELSSLDTSKDNSLGSLITRFLAEQATFAKEFTANIFHVNGDVCVDDVCITKEEFKQMLINAKGTANTDVTTPEIEVTPTVVPPPVATPPIETENPPVVENEIVTNPLPLIDTEPVITPSIETVTEPINDTTVVVSLPESPVSDDSNTIPSEN